MFMEPIHNYRVILFKWDVFVKSESFAVFLFGNFKNYNILCFAVYIAIMLQQYFTVSWKTKI